MKREFSAAAAWSMSASWIEQAAGALIFLIIARLIGVESFGVAAMAFAFLFLGEFLVRDTITEAIIERPELEEGRLEVTFFLLVGLSAAITLILMIAAWPIASLYGQSMVAWLLIAVSPTVLFVGLGGVSTALLRRRMEYKTLAIRTIVGVVAGGLVGVVMALNGYGAWSLVGQRLVEIGLNTVLAILGSKWWPKRLPRRDEFGLIRGLGPRVLELRFWTLVVMQTPTVMLGIFADPKTTGLFAFASRMVDIVLKVTIRVIHGVAQSAIAELRRKSGGTSGFFLDLSELAALAGFVCFAGLAMIATPLTRVLLGDEWDAAGDIIPFLAIWGAILALTITQESYLLATDRLEGFLKAIRVEAILGIVLLVVASRYGAIAVSAVVALRALLVLPWFTRAALTAEAVPMTRFLDVLKSPALVAAAMLVVLALWRSFAFGQMSDGVYLVIAIALGVVTSAGTLFGFLPGLWGRLKSFRDA